MANAILIAQRDGYDTATVESAIRSSQFDEPDPFFGGGCIESRTVVIHSSSTDDFGKLNNLRFVFRSKFLRHLDEIEFSEAVALLKPHIGAQVMARVYIGAPYIDKLQELARLGKRYFEQPVSLIGGNKFEDPEVEFDRAPCHSSIHTVCQTGLPRDLDEQAQPCNYEGLKRLLSHKKYGLEVGGGLGVLGLQLVGEA